MKQLRMKQIGSTRYPCLILKTLVHGQNTILLNEHPQQWHQNTFNASSNKQKVASVEAQYHCMSIIHKTITFLNENQIPIDVLDHPVYAYSKEVQQRCPTIFGHGKYLSLVGDLHIEQSILGLHGDLIKESGLDSVLVHTNLQTIRHINHC